MIEGTWTRYTFTGTAGEEFRVALGDVLTFDRGKVGRVVAIEEGEWRFSRAPKLRLTLETEWGEVTTLLHPNQPEHWPATVRDSLTVEPVSNRYKLPSCELCEASPDRPGENDHCVFDGNPHDWHRCDGIVAPDSNCPSA